MRQSNSRKITENSFSNHYPFKYITAHRFISKVYETSNSLPRRFYILINQKILTSNEKKNSCLSYLLTFEYAKSAYETHPTNTIELPTHKALRKIWITHNSNHRPGPKIRTYFRYFSRTFASHFPAGRIRRSDFAGLLDLGGGEKTRSLPSGECHPVSRSCNPLGGRFIASSFFFRHLLGGITYFFGKFRRSPSARFLRGSGTCCSICSRNNILFV